MLNTTPVFTQIRKALNDPNIRGIVLEGGSRSSKSFSVGQALLVHGLENPNLTILTARQKYTWIRMSVLDTMHKVIENMGLGVKFTRSPFRLEWNGCNMTFGGLDTPQKIHGVETDIFWINEAVEATKDDFDQLEQRCKDKWIMDYNPSTDEHWIYENVLKRDDVVYIHSTVFDNPFAPENVVKKIKSYEPTEENIAAGTADDFKWEVYGLGKRSRREGVVFTNWELCKAMPTDYQWECYGIDFGFTNDPTTIIRVVFADGQIWLDEMCYETGMTNQDIAKRLLRLGVTQSKEIVADSAEPKSIREIKLEGFNIHPSVKGQDSIRATIDIVKRYKINVTERSENAIKELKNYVWMKDYATNKYKDKPIHDYNHCFIGDTEISTNNGLKKIENIKEGDLVLTREGYKPVLKKWHNGYKKTIELKMLFGTFSLSLTCTESHKFKTSEGWKKAKDLKGTETIYLHKSLMEKCTTYTKGRGTLVKDVRDCIELYGNIIMEKFLKGITFIMSMATLITIPLTILILLMVSFMLDIPQGINGKTILKASKNFMIRELKKLKNGISRMRVLLGIGNKEKKHGLVENQQLKSVPSVGMNTKHTSLHDPNTAIITAKLKGLEREKPKVELVYDLTVEGKPEYFANGVLVHNCLDPLRYIAERKLSKKQSGVYIIR